MNTHEQISMYTQLYYREIYKYCRRRINSDEAAADVTQEVFVYFCEQYSGIEQHAIRKWLYTVAHNRCVEYYRRLKKETVNVEDIPIEEMNDETTGLFYSPLDIHESTDTQKLMKNVIDQLNPEDYELYQDWKIKKLEYTEIAKKNEISEVTARKRISRLKEKILKIIETMFHSLIF